MKENFAAKNENYQPKIKIIGVGGCGIRAVNTMIENNMSGVDFLVINSDKETLDLSRLDEQQKIQFGENLTNGFSTDGNPIVDEKDTEKSIDKIKEIVKGTDILFIINGIKDSSTGAISVITKLAKEQGTINIVFAVTPTRVEGNKKNEYAEKALQEFTREKSCIDSVINVSNERFIELVDRKATLENVFNLANEEISKCIKALVDIFREEKGLISLKFKDFKKFMTNVGFTGIGISPIYPFDSQKSAIAHVMYYPLIKGSFENAEKVLINIQGGSHLNLHIVHEIVEKITNEIKENAEVLLSVQIDKDYFSSNEFKIMVITA